MICALFRPALISLFHFSEEKTRFVEMLYKTVSGSQLSLKARLRIYSSEMKQPSHTLCAGEREKLGDLLLRLKIRKFRDDLAYWRGFILRAVNRYRE